jgi:hypothetical protein
MAIRILGSEGSDSKRVFVAKKRDGDTEERIASEGSKVDRSEHESNIADNSSESNTDGQANEFVDVESIDIGDSGGQRTYTGKRRGRKPGSRNKQSGNGSKSNTSKTTDSIAAMLFTIHSVAGSLLKMPSVQIPKKSCRELAEAMMQVTELYEIPLLDEKGMAWTNLAAVACKVYIFRGEAEIVVDNVNKKVTVISEPVEMPSWMRG